LEVVEVIFDNQAVRTDKSISPMDHDMLHRTRRKGIEDCILSGGGIKGRHSHQITRAEYTAVGDNDLSGGLGLNGRGDPSEAEKKNQEL
jgi:hypothetical protein